MLHAIRMRLSAQLACHALPALAGVVLLVLVATTRADTAETTPEPAWTPLSLEEQKAFILPQVDPLALSDEVKAILDERIRPIRNKVTRTETLHALLFGPDGFDVRYHGAYTRTAMETLARRNGNCVSLANLFVASARYVDLNAYFQESQDEIWEDVGDQDYYVLTGHINVLVKAGFRRRVTVEFLDAYIGQQLDTRILDDGEALAQYYNNLAMLELQVNQPIVARKYLDKALSEYHESALLWSNLGMVEKRLGDLAAAEKAYLTALKYDDEHPSAAKNLYVLYTQTDRPEEAARYYKIIERHNRRNPYYLNRLAEAAIEQGRYEEARNLARRAIDLKESEHKFYFSLAQAYYFAGETERAREAMEKARELASRPADQRRYQDKLDSLVSA